MTLGFSPVRNGFEICNTPKFIDDLLCTKASGMWITKGPYSAPTLELKG